MKLYALDASAWLRVFLHDGPVPAALETAAAEVELGHASFVAPELILVEAGHALHRRFERGQLSAAELKSLWRDMKRVPIDLLRHADHMDSALLLAAQHKLSVYDALYLAVALHTGARLISTDDELVKAAKKCNLAAN